MNDLISIFTLLAVIIFVLARLPKVDLGHSPAFIRRRVMNWLPLGLTYAFLYMGRYNLTVSKNALGALMTNQDFNTIFGIGTVVYGCSFVLNGPLTDRWGGRATILISALGSAFVNLLMGAVIYLGYTENLTLIFTVLYSANMYFQSFGAVSIVKVNAAWFHVRERGTFGGIFGILISLGIYFAFDWGGWIVKNISIPAVFFVPVGLLVGFSIINFFFVHDTPGKTGHIDFDTADASSGDTGPRLTALEVAKRMAKDPVIVTIALIEFCSGFLRNSIMQQYLIFAKQTEQMSQYVASHWGLMNCVAGILGGVFAGTISDKFFHSRRGPVSAVLYGIILVGSVLMIPFLASPTLGWIVLFMMLSVIGVHGMLSGTASMDFGGRKNVGVAVGLIDGMVYLGTGFQSMVYYFALPQGDAVKDPLNWKYWPVAMIPMAALGFYFATRVWNAKPTGKVNTH